MWNAMSSSSSANICSLLISGKIPTFSGLRNAKLNILELEQTLCYILSVICRIFPTFRMICTCCLNSKCWWILKIFVIVMRIVLFLHHFIFEYLSFSIQYCFVFWLISKILFYLFICWSKIVDIVLSLYSKWWVINC